MTPEALKKKIETLAPGTQAEVHDMTGTEDHYQARIISPAFTGKMTVDQHRMVMELLKTEIDSGEVHALTMKTFSPEQFERTSK